MRDEKRGLRFGKIVAMVVMFAVLLVVLTCLVLHYNNGRNAEKTNEVLLNQLYDVMVRNQADEEEILAEKSRVFAPLNNKAQNAMSHPEFEDPIRQVMDYYAKFRRNMAGMAVALDRLDFIDKYRSRVKAENLHDLMRIHEAFEILDLCRIHLAACMQRKESGRGMFVLTDYPEKDPKLAKGLIVSKGENGPRYTWLEPANS